WRTIATRLSRPAYLTAPSEVCTSSGADSSSPAAITARADSRSKTLKPPSAQPSRRARTRYSFGFTSIAALPVRGLGSGARPGPAQITRYARPLRFAGRHRLPVEAADGPGRRIRRGVEHPDRPAEVQALAVPLRASSPGVDGAAARPVGRDDGLLRL